MKFIDYLSKLPPFIARKDVGKLLGGAISPKSLANLSSLGKLNVEQRYAGRLVIYNTESLLNWLDQR